MQRMLETIVADNRALTRQGQVARYIPELARIDPTIVGIAVIDANGQLHLAGDTQVRFTLQSVSKVFALMLALEDQGFDGVFSRIGMEPTGDAFNSIVKLETFSSLRPLNPLINAGAITTSSLIAGNSVEERFQRLYEYIGAIAGPERISFNERVYHSEKATGDRNRAIGYFLRDIGAIEGDVEEALDLYFRQCSIETDVIGLATLGRRLALGPEADPPLDGEILRLALTFMYTCGMYNATGEFAVKVGIPAKSGVSGAIMAAVPGKQMGIGVIAPALDEKGNSKAGVQVLADLSRHLGLAVFAAS
mgnify:CR=1 FL=1